MTKNVFEILYTRIESEYNRYLETLQDVFVAHTVLMDFVELADAYFFDDKTLYLMHNKTKFSGEGVRDVTGQVLTSSEYLQRLLTSTKRDETLKVYYEKIVAERPKIKGKITEEEFVSLFTTKQLCFVVGYIKEYKRNTQATYGEYLTVETERRLAQRGHGFISISTSTEH